MPALNTIPLEKLARRIGVPDGPAIIDVQTDEDFAVDPRLIPSALRRPYDDITHWWREFQGRSAVVACQ